jgi:UDP-glucose 4-epimerase
MAAESGITGPVNVGHGQETSVLELIAALSDISPEKPLPAPDYRPARPGEVRRSCLDVSRARTELGWEAGVSLREGLRTILAGLP